jgi:predicted transcriptional regulator
MPDKKTMTLNLSEEEMNSLEQLAQRNDLTKTALIRKAIRIYLVLETRMQRGERRRHRSMALGSWPGKLLEPADFLCVQG